MNADKMAKAIKKGDKQKAAQILQNPGFNINEIDIKSGRGFLQLAMEHDEYDIFKMILSQKGIDLNIVSKEGESPLETAILMNSLEYVQDLLNKNINPKKRNIKGESIMHVAIKNKINLQILKKLIHHHFDINQQIAEYGSLLNLAISFDQFNNFECLLQQPNIPIKPTDAQGNTSLMLATYQKKGDFVAVILEKLKTNALSDIQKQFYLNAQNEDGNTALHLAALKDYQNILEKILQEGEPYGIDKTLRNKAGKTYDQIIQDNKQLRLKEIQNENKKRQQRHIRHKQKQEEKLRKIKEEQMLKKEQKRKRKQEEAQLEQQMLQRKQTQKSKSLWICGIGIIIIFGIMYLAILGSINSKPKSDF